MRDIRTDLALELRENLGRSPKGVEVEEYQTDQDFHVTHVEITSLRGEAELGKPMGNYITVEMESISGMPPERLESAAKEVGAQIEKLSTGNCEGTILIVGLGNRKVTPDALGPKVTERVFVTRHIRQHIPEAIDQRAATVCAIAPGVLGVTGMETEEVVSSICSEIKPSLVIAIDALASRKTGRIGASIQISDTGISPGSGLGNHRKSLNEEGLGAKVMAIGVPMVTYAATIAGDLVENALGASVDEGDLRQLVDAVVSAEGGELIVTPKNIDVLIDKTSQLVAKSLNYALHRGISAEEIRAFME